MERVLARFEGDVQLVLYPFTLNPTSEAATQAALCAGEQENSGNSTACFMPARNSGVVCLTLASAWRNSPATLALTPLPWRVA